MELYELTSSEVRRRIQANTLTLEQYAEALLARHKERDAVVQAWAYLDPKLVIESARRLDRLAPEERGSLHGFVIGVKDIINTKDSPTRHNSSYHAEDGPQIDASTVAILRANGALIMGMLHGHGAGQAATDRDRQNDDCRVRRRNYRPPDL